MHLASPNLLEAIVAQHIQMFKQKFNILKFICTKLHFDVALIPILVVIFGVFLVWQ